MIKVKANGWPWQKIEPFWASDADKTTGQRWGWNPLKVKGMGRFGGGWAFKFGITVSSSMREWILDLGLGSLRIKFGKAAK